MYTGVLQQFNKILNFEIYGKEKNGDYNGNEKDVGQINLC